MAENVKKSFHNVGKFVFEENDGFFKKVYEVVSQEIKETKNHNEPANADLDGYIYLATAQGYKKLDGTHQTWCLVHMYIRDKMKRDIMNCMGDSRIGELLEVAKQISRKPKEKYSDLGLDEPSVE